MHPSEHKQESEQPKQVYMLTVKDGRLSTNSKHGSPNSKIEEKKQTKNRPKEKYF